MCRIISFISSAGGIGKTSIIYELSKDLSSSKNKVCVFDGYFGINNLSLKYENDDDVDLKEYLVGNLSLKEVVNKANYNLFYIKSNSASFDYLLHFELIKFFVEELSSFFDYILIDVNSLNMKNLSLFLECSNEMILICSNENITIRNSAKLLQKACYYSNIKNQKIILNMARVIGEIKGNFLGEKEIEEILKREIVFVIPKFYKNNYFLLQKDAIKKRIFFKKLTTSIIQNKKIYSGYKDKYKGFLGLLRRRFYEKFE